MDDVTIVHHSGRRCELAPPSVIPMRSFGSPSPLIDRDSPIPGCEGHKSVMTDGDPSELCVFNLAASGMSLAFGEVTGSHIARGSRG